MLTRNGIGHDTWRRSCGLSIWERAEFFSIIMRATGYRQLCAVTALSPLTTVGNQSSTTLQGRYHGYGDIAQPGYAGLLLPQS